MPAHLTRKAPCDAPPFPYQVTGAAFLAERTAAYLGDDPGLGKTRQVIDAADAVGARRILVIGPASLKVNWVREFERFSRYDRPVCVPNPRTYVPLLGPLLCVVNYEIVPRAELHWLLLNGDWDVVAGDEFHRCKEPAALTTRAVLGEKGLHKASRHFWPMSGTPAPNHPGELYPTLAALYPQAVQGMDYVTWLRHYCHTAPGTYKERVVGLRPEIWQLRQHLDRFMIRRRREDVLPDLPALTTSVWHIEDDKALAAVRKAMKDAPEDERDEQLLALLGDETVDDYLLETIDETAMSTLRRLCGEAKAHLLVDLLAEELDHGQDKVVLMCWHRSTMDILQAGLERFGVARIDGATKNRQAEVDRFQDSAYSTSCRVFIGQIQAAGTGHTLTAAHNMVIVEPSWVPGENFQAMLRINRIGQLYPCLVRFACLAGSLDTAIMTTSERKTLQLTKVGLA